jgi:hypothetical protein
MIVGRMEITSDICIPFDKRIETSPTALVDSGQEGKKFIEVL